MKRAFWSSFVFYIADKSGTITAYADADPTDPASPIVKKASLRLPALVTGLTVRMNTTFDGSGGRCPDGSLFERLGARIGSHA